MEMISDIVLINLFSLLVSSLTSRMPPRTPECYATLELTSDKRMALSLTAVASPLTKWNATENA